ncbi:phosphatidylethanolamine-binding protein like protein F40A3.3 [Ditylenchus destructor]|nr:phosphatidylethanolamine-binding protein like protein F40A3.3 [Ditylenchus destructor]
MHRYVFLVYLQDGPLDDDPHIKFIPKTTMKGRPMFRAQMFADRHMLGAPVAGNFFQAEYDSYVPTLHKQIGFSPR